MIALSLIGSALGSTFVDVPSLETLVRDSATVVRGTVTVTHTEPCSLGLCTTYTVAVSETWRGETLEALRVTLPGGRTGGLTQRVAGLPLWKKGDDVVLFLDERGQPGWTRLFTVVEGSSPSGATAIPHRELADPIGRRRLTPIQSVREQLTLERMTRP